MIKAVLLDFDGTLVTKDILPVIAKIVGKEQESLELDNDFHKGKSKGLSGLIIRINMLKGVSVTQIKNILKQENYLMPGAHEFLEFLNNNGIITILASGNILPVLEYYRSQEHFKIDYLIGSQPHIKDDIIEGISEKDYSDCDYKLTESKQILNTLGIAASETLAIGDSPGDKSRFFFAGKSIAINPKEGIEKYADYIIHDSLIEAIEIIQKLNNY
jgi:phosphoserine phosphatase